MLLSGSNQDLSQIHRVPQGLLLCCDAVKHCEHGTLDAQIEMQHNA